MRRPLPHRADAQLEADCSGLTASPGQKRAMPYHIGSNRMTLSVCLDTQVHHLCHKDGCCQLSKIADAQLEADCSGLTASPGQKRAMPYHIGSNRMTLSVCLDTQVHHLCHTGGCCYQKLPRTNSRLIAVVSQLAQIKKGQCHTTITDKLGDTSCPSPVSRLLLHGYTRSLSVPSCCW
jgi:hypothetical protein